MYVPCPNYIVLFVVVYIMGVQVQVLLYQLVLARLMLQSVAVNVSAP